MKSVLIDVAVALGSNPLLHYLQCAAHSGCRIVEHRQLLGSDVLFCFAMRVCVHERIYICAVLDGLHYQYNGSPLNEYFKKMIYILMYVVNLIK